MVVKKRLDTRATGFQIPIVPRAPRSARRRGLLRKISDANDICAIELLASLAGKLLQESESSSASNNSSEDTNQLSITKDAIKHERQDEDRPLKTECIEQSSCRPCCEETLLHSEQASEDTSSKCSSEPSIKTEGDSTNPKVTGTAFSIEIKSPVCKDKNEVGISSEIMGTTSGLGGPPDVKLESQKEQNLDRQGTGGITCPKDPMEYNVKVPAINSTGLMQKSFLKDPRHVATFSRHRNDTKLGHRDGDEKFPRFNKCSNKLKSFRHPQRIADRRIRKLLASKYWRAAPRLKDCELSKVEGGLKGLNQKRKVCYNGERYHNDLFYKRRKLLDRSSIAISDGVLSSESVSNLPQKDMIGNKNDTYASVHGESGVSSSVFGDQSSFHAKDAHVKFSIKSVRIPELYVDVPETATVGLLKRTVMEAVNAILGSGLRVGVVLRGKKVRDDNRTLLQTGISCKENLDELGFTLEPSQPRTPPIMAAEDPPSLTCDTPPLMRSPDNPVSDPITVEATSNPLLLTSIDNTVDDNQQAICSQSDVLSDNTMSGSKALVPVPASAPEMHPEPLAIVPVNPKNKRSELSQRRIRRPFSVTEVEALVHAVEELGTGRWRDVKLRAFENADHRTYVDLKDKWKTLVHTASISPQQRRGEPVPQELLDRVLAAHAYWSQHQAKQHGKSHATAPKVADVLAERSQVEAAV